MLAVVLQELKGYQICCFILKQIQQDMYQTVMLARKWLNANISCCPTKANRSWNKLFYPKIWPDVPSGFHYALLFKSVINQEVVRW